MVKRTIIVVLLALLALPGRVLAQWPSTKAYQVLDSMFTQDSNFGFPPYAAEPFACTAETRRTAYYNTTSNLNFYCDGTAWAAIGSQATISGAELLSNGTFDSDLTGWTGGTGGNWIWSAGKALHNYEGVAALAQNIAVAGGYAYQISFTIGGRTAGSVTVSLGGVTLANPAGGTTFSQNAIYVLTLVASGTSIQSFAVTPIDQFDGSVDALSCKGIAGLTTTATLFANLGTPANGTVVYCSDCANVSNPCAGASTGAIAKRLNGAWDCR